MIYNRFTLSIVSLCFASLFSFASFSAAATTNAKHLPVLDRIVATVNREAITESELENQAQLLLLRLKQSDTPLPPMTELRQQLLERMILEKLQLQLAATEGIEIDDATLEQSMKEIAKRDGLTVHQMQQFLEEQGITPAQFRQTIKTEMTLSRLQAKTVGQQITVSKAEVENFLHSPAGHDQSGAEYHLGHILISPPNEEPSKQDIQQLENRAGDLAKELKNGANFSKLAIAKSAGQQALTGGDLGWRKIGEIPSTFVKVVPTLKVGEVYGPIRDNSGFHIIKLLEKRNPETQHASAETLRNKATEILYQRKFDESLVSWLRHLRADSKVEIYLNET